MKTYNAYTLRKAFDELVDKDKYVRFTWYNKEKGRPDRLKGKPCTLYATPSGLVIEFTNIYFNKTTYWGRLTLYVKSIRWETNPFKTPKFEELCEKFEEESVKQGQLLPGLKE